MAHFALIKETIVIAVIIVDNNAITDNGVEVEQLGIDLIDSLNIKGVYDYDTVRQTSYNSNFRKGNLHSLSIMRSNENFPQ